MNQEAKLKPSEKLSVLEQQSLSTARRVGEMEMIIFNLARENDILREAVQLLDEKLNSTIELIAEGKALTNENINEKAVELKEKLLKQKVDESLANGRIELTEVVGDNSFVVARELDDNGQVINPRIQFLTAKLVPELKDKIVGKQTGELVKTEEGKLSLELMEIYNFVEIPLQEQPQAQG
jgi:vacuolar-type H+-ATPase subunit I/STV1